MAKNKSTHTGNPLQDRLAGMASGFLKDVIQADMSMHKGQAEAWKHFAEYAPAGEYIPSNIYEGFASKQYLALRELKLGFSIKPVPLNLATRIRYAWHLLTRSNIRMLHHPVAYELCAPAEEQSIAVTMTVSRFENGTVSATYEASDKETEMLLS